MWQSFVLAESRFPHELIPSGIGKRRDQNRSRTKEHIARTRNLDMFNIDQDDANKNDADKEQTFGGNFSAEEVQNDRRGKDGGLPGGGDHPPRGEGSAECDEGIKDSETDGASQNPKAPMLEEDIFDIGKRFATLRDKDDNDEKDQHVPKAQARGPCPMPACETHRAVEDEGAAEE